MTTKQRPPAETVLKEMKSLEEKEIGNVKAVTRVQTAYYKPLPSEENKIKVTEIVGESNWDTYVQHFKDRCT